MEKEALLNSPTFIEAVERESVKYAVSLAEVPLGAGTFPQLCRIVIQIDTLCYYASVSSVLCSTE